MTRAITLTRVCSLSGLFTARFLLLVRAYNAQDSGKSKRGKTKELSTFRGNPAPSGIGQNLSSIIDEFGTDPVRRAREAEEGGEQIGLHDEIVEDDGSNEFVVGSSSGATLGMWGQKTHTHTQSSVMGHGADPV